MANFDAALNVTLTPIQGAISQKTVNLYPIAAFQALQVWPGGYQRKFVMSAKRISNSTRIWWTVYGIPDPTGSLSGFLGDVTDVMVDSMLTT